MPEKGSQGQIFDSLSMYGHTIWARGTKFGTVSHQGEGAPLGIEHFPKLRRRGPNGTNFVGIYPTYTPTTTKICTVTKLRKVFKCPSRPATPDGRAQRPNLFGPIDVHLHRFTQSDNIHHSKSCTEGASYWGVDYAWGGVAPGAKLFLPVLHAHVIWRRASKFGSITRHEAWIWISSGRRMSRDSDRISVFGLFSRCRRNALSDAFLVEITFWRHVVFGLV